ncbi:MAG: PP2C family protein-serine/threonine phosphatase [Myxococcota bacterium]
MADDQKIIIGVFGRTDVGTVRDHNEDNFLVANLSTGENSLKPEIRNHELKDEGSIFMVCDGMGGAAAGEVASQIATTSIFEKLKELGKPENRKSLALNMVKAIKHANSAIYQEAQQNRAKQGMGTTCTLAALMDDIILVGQVGDSRAYLIRHHQMYQMTQDQTLLNRLLEVGKLSDDEAAKFEHNHVILQALGVKNKVEPVLSAAEIAPGDSLLLCSDGLNDALNDKEILQIINNHDIHNQVEICQALTQQACQKGAKDNVTVIFATFSGQGYGPGDLQSEIPYIKIPKTKIDSNYLLNRSHKKTTETTQVFGSFNLE